MSERYIVRYSLPEQGYPLGCPVKLTKARLLEDTRLSRLVAQCKFVPVTQGIMALRVRLRCMGENGEDLGEVSFAYRDLRAARGQAFGQYSAITLPAGTCTFTVEAVGAVLFTGRSWSRAAAQAAEAQRLDAQVPPVQTPKPSIDLVKKEAEHSIQIPPQAAVKKTEKQIKPIAGRVSKKAAGIAAAVAAAVLLAVVLLPKLTSGDVVAKEDPPIQNKPASAGSSETPTQAAPVQGGSAAGSSPQAVQSTDYGENGDITRVYITRSADGYYELTPDQITPYLSDSVTTCAWEGISMGDDPMDYLKNSFTFAWLVGMGLHEDYGLSGDGTWISEINPDQVIAVFAFNSRTLSMVGYFIGVPTQYDADTICFDMVQCEYPLAALQEQEYHAFEAGKSGLFQNYVDAGSDLRATGAKYYLWGYNTSTNGQPQDDDVQGYHLWQQLNSPYTADLVRDIDHLERRLAQGNRDPSRHMLFLLLNGSYEVVGFTYMP